MLPGFQLLDLVKMRLTGISLIPEPEPELSRAVFSEKYAYTDMMIVVPIKK